MSRCPLSGYSDWLRAGRSGDTIPVGARFSAPVQTGPGAHPASCAMGTVSFLGVKSGRDVLLTLHLFLVLWSRKSRAIPLLLLWAVRPVQSLSPCTRMHFIFFTFCAVNNNMKVVFYTSLGDLCNKKQFYVLFILSLFRQSTSICFGHICSPSSGRMGAPFSTVVKVLCYKSEGC